MNRTGKKRGDKCEPAASVIVKFGGVWALARELAIDPSAISKWQSRRVGGGLIPAKYHAPLFHIARENSIPLTSADLVGRDK